jgi:hypothetical protein
MKNLSWGDDLRQTFVNMTNDEGDADMVLPWRDVESLPPEEEVADAFDETAHQTRDTEHQTDETAHQARDTEHQTAETAHQAGDAAPPDDPGEAEYDEAPLNDEEQSPESEGEVRPAIEKFVEGQAETPPAEDKETSGEETWTKPAAEVEERSEEDELYHREREEM